MKKAVHPSRLKSLGLKALAGLAFCVQPPLAVAQNLVDTGVVGQSQSQSLPVNNQAKISYNTYILGPGDGLQIELLDLPELSGHFSIGPDGTLYLPRLRALYVEGLTVKELRHLLTQKFSTYVHDPQVYVRPVVYRPIRIYVGGEVMRPGYYTLSGETNLNLLSNSAKSQQLQANTAMKPTRTELGGAIAAPGHSAVFPTVYDAIRTAQGVTAYSNLAQVQVTRKRAEGQAAAASAPTSTFFRSPRATNPRTSASSTATW